MTLTLTLSLGLFIRLQRYFFRPNADPGRVLFDLVESTHQNLS
jgi:hypothetical protein